MSQPTIITREFNTTGGQTGELSVDLDTRNHLVNDLSISSPYNYVELPRDAAALRELAADLTAAANALEAMKADENRHTAASWAW